MLLVIPYNTIGAIWLVLAHDPGLLLLRAPCALHLTRP